MPDPTPEVLDDPAAIDPAPPRRLRLDASGRALPLTDEERASDAAAALEGLAALDAIPDDPAGSDEAFWRGIDEERPERPLFGGMY